MTDLHHDRRRTVRGAITGKLARYPAIADIAWVGLLALAFSFPVGALFEGPDVLVSFYVAPALLLLPAIAVLALPRLDPGKRSALGLTVLLGMALSIAALVVIEPSSSALKIGLFWACLGLFGAATAAVIWSGDVYPILDRVLIGLGGCALAMLVLAPSFYPSGRMSFGMANPIWVARDIGLLGLGCLSLMARDRRYLLIASLGIFLCLYGMVLTRSRGPILALLLAFGIGGLILDYRNKARILAIGAAIVILAGAFSLHWNLQGVSRLIDFTGTDKSTSLRLGLYQYCLSSLRLFTNGMGVGNFQFRTLTYPHNIFVEFLLEWGWIAGSAYIAAILSGSAALLRSGPEYSMLKLLLIFELVNGCFSGDVTSPRFLYGLVIIGNAMIVMNWRRARAPAVTRDGERRTI